MKKLNSENWSTLAVSVGEEMGRRWLSVWGGYYRDAAVLVANSRVTQRLAAESARSYHLLSREFEITPDVDGDLNFEFDYKAQSAGPRYIRLPNPNWENTPLPDHALGVGGPLSTENVMVRVESGLLSVTLVALQGAHDQVRNTRLVPGSPPSGTNPNYGTYALTFPGQQRKPLTLTATARP
jgi:hypothetical protein